MTNKQRRLVEAIRAGVPLEDVAAEIGYTEKYARKLLEEPAIRAAIEADVDPLQVEAPAGGALSLDPGEMLRSIISDPHQDTRVRITATRALAMLERGKPQDSSAPVLIDDIPDCDSCPGCRKEAKT